MVVVVGAVVVVVGAVVVVVGAVVVVAEVVVVVVGGGGVPGVTSPLSAVARSWLFVVAMQTSVDAHETSLSWFVVAPRSALHVEPPLPVPASDTVVPAPPAQQVNVLAQLMELTQPSVAGEDTSSHEVPKSWLVATALAPPPARLPPA